MRATDAEQLRDRAPARDGLLAVEWDECAVDDASEEETDALLVALDQLDFERSADAAATAGASSPLSMRMPVSSHATAYHPDPLGG